MDAAQILTSLVPTFSHIEEAPLGTDDKIFGWESTFIDKDGNALGGGVSAHRNLALQIGFAETLERALFLKEKSADTTCGFAFGFEKESTKTRSENEAIERWAWSKWIDEKYFIQKFRPDNLSPLAQYFSGQFENVIYFRKELFSKNGTRLGVFCVALGESGPGLFAGSRFGQNEADCWTHALSETWRHHLQFKIELESEVPENIFSRRIHRFGRNAQLAKNQIPKAEKSPWPPPTFRVQTEVETGINGAYLFRSLCNDYIPWSWGGEERFVY